MTTPSPAAIEAARRAFERAKTYEGGANPLGKALAAAYAVDFPAPLAVPPEPSDALVREAEFYAANLELLDASLIRRFIVATTQLRAALAAAQAETAALRSGEPTDAMVDAAMQRDELKQELAQKRKDWIEAVRVVDQLDKRVVAAQAGNVTLREALRPFAEMPSHYDDTEIGPALQAARAALGARPTPSTGG